MRTQKSKPYKKSFLRKKSNLRKNQTLAKTKQKIIALSSPHYYPWIFRPKNNFANCNNQIWPRTKSEDIFFSFWKPSKRPFFHWRTHHLTLFKSLSCLFNLKSLSSTFIFFSNYFIVKNSEKIEDFYWLKISQNMLTFTLYCYAKLYRSIVYRF